MDRKVGAHLSVAGGYNNAVDAAVEIGADCLQIFSGSPRVWARKEIDPAALNAFKKYADDHDIRPIFVHALYLLNLTSENTELVQKSVKVLIHDLKFGSYFDCAGVVVHLGSHQGRGWETVRDNLALLIRDIIDQSESKVPFLIENSAGQSGKLCSDLSEIRWLLDAVDRPTLGWCFDTCHGWAAGYRMGGADGMKDLEQELEGLELWGSLRCIHLNDTRDGSGSGRDRHANIGQGNLPPKELQAFLWHQKVRGIPLITEAPGLDGNGPDKFNIDAIRAIIQA